jgi:hypothetical protein
MDDKESAGCFAVVIVAIVLSLFFADSALFGVSYDTDAIVYEKAHRPPGNWRAPEGWFITVILEEGPRTIKVEFDDYVQIEPGAQVTLQYRKSRLTGLSYGFTLADIQRKGQGDGP